MTEAVTGVDLDATRVDMVNARRSPLQDAELAAYLARPATNFTATTDGSAAFAEADVAILCLPDDAARESVRLIENGTTRVIDASTAHRVAEGWAFGFPEMAAEQPAAIAAARYSWCCWRRWPCSCRC